MVLAWVFTETRGRPAIFWQTRRRLAAQTPEHASPVPERSVQASGFSSIPGSATPVAKVKVIEGIDPYTLIRYTEPEIGHWMTGEATAQREVSAPAAVAPVGALAATAR
jgi:hypothetical protein